MPTKLHVNNARDLLNAFEFRELFAEELGWNQPGQKRAEPFVVSDLPLTRTAIAELSGIVAFEVQADAGGIPDSALRSTISRDVAKVALEHVLIFIDENRTQSVWHWTKREGGKKQPREHFYFKGQPGDLFISKIASMVVDISELDEHGKLPLIDAAKKVKDALDVERVIKRFYKDYDDLRIAFTTHILGIPDEKDRRWYASVLLNRLMFIYFLQRKFFLNGGDGKYLENKLEQSRAKGKDLYYAEFLHALFFEAFAKPETKRSAEAITLCGSIVYLNGGLFLPHQLEQNHAITVCDEAFVSLFALFNKYSWNLNDVPVESDNDINPDVLGYIFEKYINQKEFGAYYTRPEITEYLCEQTIHRLILDRINEPAVSGMAQGRMYDSVSEMLLRLDRVASRKLLKDILPDLSILDPAVGSGAFLVAALKTLVTVYSAVVGWLQFHDKAWLESWLRDGNTTYERVQYAIKKAIITDNLYGVDIMEEATEIAKLRLFMTLVASAHTVTDLEPLPNIDFNILAGNSLIGLMRVEDAEFESKQATRDKTASLFAPTKTYRQILDDRNRKVNLYRHASGYADDLTALRDAVESVEDQARPILASILLHKFDDLGIRFEQATWDTSNSKEGKPIKRTLEQMDIDALEPLHWGFEFDRILNQKGGFDAIITNPPWEALKPQNKEFFARHSDIVSKNTMTVQQFELELGRLMSVPNVKKAYLEYLSQFPHEAFYFRNSPEYVNQVTTIAGKKLPNDLNLYKLFTERCYKLLREGGRCGTVIPSGIYSDLGAKGMRELLFAKTQISGLIGFENRRKIFDAVDSRFKFVLLAFRKGPSTDVFPTAFMRHDLRDLERFPGELSLPYSVSLVKQLSPDSMSLMELPSQTALAIVKKLLAFPLLSDKVEDSWHLRLGRELHPGDDKEAFQPTPSSDTMPLFGGANIHQFTDHFAPVKYWVNQSDIRRILKNTDHSEVQSCDRYRIAFRKIARNTDERTMIATILSPGVVTVDTLKINSDDIPARDMLYLCAVLNSFVFDSILRLCVTTTLNYFYIYQMPVPRLESYDPIYQLLVRRAARLICTTPDFEKFAVTAGIGSHKNGAIQQVERAQLRAELDGLIAHLYCLTEQDFTYVLSTFPLVPDPVKVAAQNAYRDVERGLIK